MRTVKIGNPERAANESFDAYRDRRKRENENLKAHLRGTLIWDSEKQGTARKKK